MVLAACKPDSGSGNKPVASSSPDASPAPTGYSVIPRAEFNLLAVRATEPVFWVEDQNNDGELQPSELATYSAFGKSPALTDYVKDGKFTEAFTTLFKQLDRLRTSTPPAELPAAEVARQKAMIDELAAGRVSLITSDFSALPLPLQRASAKILEAAALTELIFHKQMGIYDMKPAIDEESQAVFWRNQSPRCTAPINAGNAACHATATPPPAVFSGLYPQKLLATKDFCQTLDKSLMDPFTVVVEKPAEGDKPGKLEAVPYHVYYADHLGRLATLLDEAAALLTPDTADAGVADAGATNDERALADYLRATAKAARTGSWFEADEAWAKMNASNSKVYLRIGPDEVYAEPCSTKALFHTSFGLINQASLTLQAKLDPQKQEMEAALAALAGAPYTERKVTFRLPDFMDVAWNAGDSRHPSGGTIGQSLPNFGPVANEGRGRTVAMTNLYLDPDNVASAKRGAESLLCKDTFSRYSTKPDGQILSTVLHEAAHNLGPSHQYKVAGKIDREAFGGPLASTLEELKAQSSALYLADWLKDKGELGAKEADEAHVRDLTWAFGHISRGMFDDAGHPRNYSQLAAIQLGVLEKSGAVIFRESELAANGTDKGCFSLDAEKFPAAAKELVTAVLQVKAKGDKATAEQWLNEYVGAPPHSESADAGTPSDAGSPVLGQHAIIRERILRSPKASFVYRVRFGAEASGAQGIVDMERAPDGGVARRLGADGGAYEVIGDGGSDATP